MAHVVPKREPCLKCNLPVFFAERLVVDKKLFHRSCLKCARCDSKLTIGNFYETEEDNVFCCETCPDEETVQTRDEKPAESSRLSMAQRISMFEKDQSVLKKSLSDEEKSRSLKRQAEIQDLKSPASTKALNSFLAAQIDQVHDQKQDLHGKMEDSSSSESDDEPPPLPREAQPQINRLGLNDFSDNLSNQLVGSSIVTKATGEGKVKTIDPVDDEFDAILQKMAEDDEITKSKTFEKAPEVFIIKEVPAIIQNPEESENVSEKALESSSKMESHEIKNVTELDNIPKSAITIPENIESIPETPIAHESFVNVLSTEITPDSSEFPVESPKIKDLTEKPIEDLTIAQETTNIIIDKESDEKPLNESDYESKVVPEVVVEAIEKIEEIIEENEINKESDNIKPEVPIPAGNIECEVKNVPKPGDSDYPDNLNPFGSDDEDENEPVPVKLHVSSNPFGSDEEDEEVPVNRTGTLKPPRPPPPKIKPSNPFGESDDEESMSEANIPRRMPVPTPRKIG